MRAFIALIITLFIVSFIGGSGYLILNNYELKKEVTKNELKIQDLKNEIIYLRNRNNRLITRKNQKQNYQRKVRSKKTYQKQEIKEIYSKPKSLAKYTPRTSYNKHQKKSTGKKYQKFSKNIKLVSDSKITILKDNRLKSNRAIYGRYYPYSQYNQINNINCKNKKRILGIRKECSMRLSLGMDLVYLGKMDARNIKNIDYRNHMIECKYSQKYGIMHDCKAKLI